MENLEEYIFIPKHKLKKIYDVLDFYANAIKSFVNEKDLVSNDKNIYLNLYCELLEIKFYLKGRI